MNVICTNEECPQFEILKDGGHFDLAEIMCGQCGQPVAEAPEPEGGEDG